MQVQDGQDDGHEEDDNATDAHTYVEHLGGCGGGGHTVYWRKQTPMKTKITQNWAKEKLLGKKWPSVHMKYYPYLRELQQSAIMEEREQKEKVRQQLRARMREGENVSWAQDPAFESFPHHLSL